MSRAIARSVLRLYPLAFQRRYGEELRALLEQSPPRLRSVLDLLRGALVAHLRPPASLATQVDPADRVRASTSGVLACWVLFAAAGFGFYKTTEDEPFSAAGHAHPVLGLAHHAIQVLAIVATAAVVLGALPLIATAVVHARRDRALGRLVGRPLIPVIVYGILTALLVAVSVTGNSQQVTGAHIAAVVWGLAGLACGAACVLACRATLFAVPVAPPRLLTALKAGTLVTFAMVGIALTTAIYALALAVDAGPLSGAPNGPLQTTVGFSLIVQLLTMCLAGGLAVATTLRGWRAAGSLAAA